MEKPSYGMEDQSPAQPTASGCHPVIARCQVDASFILIIVLCCDTKGKKKITKRLAKKVVVVIYFRKSYCSFLNVMGNDKVAASV